MRKEATPAQWKKLYSLADQFLEMKPWEYLWNQEFVTVAPEGMEEATFSVLGNGGMEYGFILYPDELSFRQARLLYSDPTGEGAEHYGLFLQNCIAMFVDRREELEPEQLDVLSRLGRSYGKGRSWVYFERHQRGYVPFLLDQQEVVLCTTYLEHLLKAITVLPNIMPKGVHIPGTEYRFWEEDGWKLGMVQRDEEKVILPMELMGGDAAEKGSLEEFRRSKKTSDIWEVDIFPLNSRVEDEEYDKPLFPHLLLVLEHNSDMPLYEKLLEPEDGFDSICTILMKLAGNGGVPKKIMVRGTIMAEGIRSFAESFGIPVVKGQLKQLDEMRRHMMAGFGEEMGEAEEDQIRLALEEMGIDPAKLTEGNMADPELVKMFGDAVSRILNDGTGEGIFPSLFHEGPFAGDRWDEEDMYGSEDLRIYDRFTNMKQKLARISDFYEYTGSLTGDSTEAEEDDWDEELCGGEIDAEWMDDWGTALRMCTKQVLAGHAKALGLRVEQAKKKEVFADAVAEHLSKNPRDILLLVSDEEREFLREMRELVKDEETIISDELPYRKEMISSLVERGIIDVSSARAGIFVDTLYLTIRLPKGLKGIHLK